MATGLWRTLAFIGTYVRLNLQAALEYRVSFWAQVFAMALNDAMWVAFWGLFFARFPTVRGYEFRDVVMLWSFGAFSFGLATGLFGGCWRYATQVTQGALDFFLVLPKPVLLHVIVSRMSVSAWGDTLFGLGCFLVLARPSGEELALFLLLSVFGAVLFVSYGVIVNSAAFWLGNADGLAEQVQGALLTFSLYPGSLFSGAVKVVLFTVVPAGIVTWLPVGLIRQWDWGMATVLVAAASASVGVAVGVFYAGLRRYESGNLLAMRS
ncbi:MAG TPA: ABC-2 family transporter protein [Chloroflexota bacterium]|nr:ABC-2 family transporter protein [Chloroflexota bacterium]